MQSNWLDAFHNSEGVLDTLLSLANHEPVVRSAFLRIGVQTVFLHVEQLVAK